MNLEAKKQKYISVIFGGTGFIGMHLARHFLHQKREMVVYLADIKPIDLKKWGTPWRELVEEKRLKFLKVDVRQPIENPDLPQQADLVVNLAAIHREPGHRPDEYFETNLRGAENVCAWAEKIGCTTVVFTSSIAPYGPTEKEKDEDSLPVPLTPYGASKLAAEKMHIAWQRGGSERELVIVRPGVVFGPGEGGNVTRLVRAVLGRYFFYMGNRQTRKAGGYIKELCHALEWELMRLEKAGERFSLFNFTMNPPPSVEEYVTAISRVAGVRRLVPSIPYPILLTLAYLLEVVARPLRIIHPFSPVRIRKLVRSNNIKPGHLQRHEYHFRYTLIEALQDWKQERPQDWNCRR